MILRLIATTLLIASCSSDAQVTSGSKSRNSYQKDSSSDFTETSNKAPIANDDKTEADQGVEMEIDILQNDYDPENDEIELFELGNSENSVFSRTDDGKISYTANDDFSGIDTFTYKISDGMSISEGQIKVKVCRKISTTFQANQAVDFKPNLADDEIIVSLKGVSGQWCAWRDRNDKRCPLSCDTVSPPISADGKSLYKSFDDPYHDNWGACTFSIRICTNLM